MRIALDAMGSDRAPRTEVLGALEAVATFGDDAEVVLVGDRQTVERELGRHPSAQGRLRIHHAPDRVSPSDPPSTVMRRMPNSSIVVGLTLHGQGEVDAFVSAGSTGAVMAASLFSLKRLPGVSRPAVGTLLPTMEGRCLLLDAGANVECKPHHLLQFAHLGAAYVGRALGRDNPRVGLLNVGKERGKGGEVLNEAHALLTSDPDINFIGNVEGRDIIASVCDVVTCDGFVGNVLLKFYESVSAFIVRLLKKGPTADPTTTDDLHRAFSVLDYSEVGGAPLLGVNGVPIICHGDSSPKAIRNALHVAAQAVRSRVVKYAAREFMTPALGQPR